MLECEFCLWLNGQFVLKYIYLFGPPYGVRTLVPRNNGNPLLIFVQNNIRNTEQ